MGVASETYAEITREQYDDWLSRFYPKQQQLLETTENADLLNANLANSTANFASSTAAAKTAEANQMARYGLSSATNQNNAGTALAGVAAKNTLREYEADRSLSTLSGSTSSISELKVET